MLWSIKPVKENKTSLPLPPASSAYGNLSSCDSSSANYESWSSEYSIIAWLTIYSNTEAMARDMAPKLPLTNNP